MAGTRTVRDATVLLVDVGASMQGAAAGLGGSKADDAVRLAQCFVQQKMLFLPRHEIGVVFFGTKLTKNELHSEGEYEHVLVAGAGTIDAPTLAVFRQLMTAPEGGAESDAVNALIVSIDLLAKRTGAMKYNKTIALITDGSSVNPGDEDLLSCFHQLKATGTKMQVTLVGASADWKMWTAFSERYPEIQLVSLQQAINVSSLCVKPVEQRAKVRLPLVVSGDLQIPVSVYSKTTRVSLPGLKKRSKLAGKVPPEHQRTDAVIAERTYHVADDQDGEEVQQENRIKGFKYGGSIVPMSEWDEAALMYQCERTLVTLGFAPQDCIGPEHCVSHTETIAADKGDRWAYCAFESLVSAMRAEDVALVARYSFRKNAPPKMVALIPDVPRDGEAASVILQYLPFCEDLRDWPFASMPVANEEQKLAVDSLTNTLSFQKAPEGVPEKPQLLPDVPCNPALRSFYNFLVRRALDPAAKAEPSAPGDLVEELTSGVMKSDKLTTLAEQLKAKFGLEKVEKSTKRTKRFWREAVLEKRKAAELEEIDTKKIKVDVVKKDEAKDEEDGGVKAEGGAPAAAEAAATAAGMAAPVMPPPDVRIGSVNPERDFEKWISHRTGGYDTVGPAIQQMCKVILMFADEGEDYIGRALSCLGTLRRGCLQEGEPIAFNEFMRQLRMAVSMRQQKLWQRARESHIGLITDSETPTSTVSIDEARAFLAGEDTCSTTKAGTVPSAAVASTAKDLEDMLE
eukprot:TRINITY_DN23476_c0_g1_i1.p1 TRINITY_DN23476_c0_g1~~TRINITY_DN23476_c0_g1_i1.p1  ORF type:complete len:768 (-),score=158.33 TRINITY_DN23476_c0_g1_i1:236-2455(-)